jgi:hypothetical protein
MLPVRSKNILRSRRDRDCEQSEAAVEENVRRDFQLAHGPPIQLENLRVPPDVEALQKIDPETVKCAVIKESFIPLPRNKFFGGPRSFRHSNHSYEIQGWGSILECIWQGHIQFKWCGSPINSAQQVTGRPLKI